MEYYQDTVLVEKQEKQDYSRRMTPKKHKFASLTVSHLHTKFDFNPNITKALDYRIVQESQRPWFEDKLVGQKS